mgnify:CR=1 FL=1
MVKLAFSKPMLLCIGGILAKSVCIAVISGSAIYYYNYVVGDKSGLAWYMSISTFILLAGGALTPFLVNKIGTKIQYLLDLRYIL